MRALITVALVPILLALDERFGTTEKWAADFKSSAQTANGWVVLAKSALTGRLYNLVCDEHSDGALWMTTPLIALDVYEHAYYVDYQSRKGDYIEAFMSHINWAQAEARFLAS